MLTIKNMFNHCILMNVSLHLSKIFIIQIDISECADEFAHSDIVLSHIFRRLLQLQFSPVSLPFP